MSGLTPWILRREPLAGPTSHRPVTQVNQSVHGVAHHGGGIRDEIRESDFNMQGKPLNRVVAHASTTVQTNVRAVNSISEQTFLPAAKLVFTNVVGVVRGSQLAMAERANIERAAATAYGNRHALQDLSAPTIYAGSPGRVPYGFPFA